MKLLLGVPLDRRLEESRGYSKFLLCRCASVLLSTAAWRDANDCMVNVAAFTSFYQTCAIFLAPEV